MIIKAGKVKIEKNTDGTLTVLTDGDTEREYRKLRELDPGTIFIAGDKKFAVLRNEYSLVSVCEVGSLEDRTFDDNCNNWQESELRNYLNTKVLGKYEKIFGAENLVEAPTVLTSLDGLEDYGECSDKIRLMTFDEYRDYQHLLEREQKYEWLVTPWSTSKRDVKYSVCCVSSSGGINYFNCDCNYAVRPFCILQSNILVSVEE